MSHQAEPAAKEPEPRSSPRRRDRDMVLTVILVAAIITMIIVIATMTGLLNRPI